MRQLAAAISHRFGAAGVVSEKLLAIRDVMLAPARQNSGLCGRRGAAAGKKLAELKVVALEPGRSTGRRGQI
jgi:hypothetical protein